MKVLIVSASMGGGHDGAARELASRLRRRGDEVRVEDFLAAFPLHAGALVRSGYMWELRLAPWSYDASYRMWYSHPRFARPLTALLSATAGPAMRRWVAETEPDVVVSTYPMSSLVFGRDRQRGALKVPVATYVTDFAVHPLWTHPGIDEHICVHPQAAADAVRNVGGAASAPGPLVPDRFLSALPERSEARARLGLPDDVPIVLLVCGSWGIGELEQTYEDVVATGRYTPVVICGRNDRLRRALQAHGGGVVVGWTDDMPTFMAAADVLVQNAGGLTCMEAFAAGLPVVSYRPIAGHGKDNAVDMARAGVAAVAHGPEDLGTVLDDATGPRRDSLVEAARSMFAADPADVVEQLGKRAARTPDTAGRHALVRVRRGPAPVRRNAR